MGKTDLDLFGKGAPLQRKSSFFDAMARTRDRMKERREDHLAALEAAELARVPRRYLQHRCAVTGQVWVTEWRKEEFDTYFRPGQRTLITGGADAASGAAAHAAQLVSFDVREFDLSPRPCPGCGDTNLHVICNCNAIVCGGRSKREAGTWLYRCVPSCRDQFVPLGVATTVHGKPGESQRALKPEPARKVMGMQPQAPAPRKAITDGRPKTALPKSEVRRLTDQSGGKR